MTNTGKFIKDAIEGGWEPIKDVDYANQEQTTGLVMFYDRFAQAVAILDPEAWKAVGKARKWVESKYSASFGSIHPALAHNFSGHAYIRNTWQYHMHGLTQALIEGKTIEKYLGTIV